ncbi:MAG: hypothetical protein ACREL1_03075 [bacterium]
MSDRQKNQTRGISATKFAGARRGSLGAIEKPEFFALAFRLSVFVSAFFVGSVLAQASTPSTQDPQVTQAAERMQKTQDEVQKLKDAWDRSRLEAALYNQRSQRAYRRWVAAKKDWKKKMGEHKDRAQLEFELAVEKRKLAYGLWQEARDRFEADQRLLDEAEQKGNVVEIKNHIADIQKKLDAPSASDAKP